MNNQSREWNLLSYAQECGILSEKDLQKIRDSQAKSSKKSLQELALRLGVLSLDGWKHLEEYQNYQITPEEYKEIQATIFFASVLYQLGALDNKGFYSAISTWYAKKKQGGSKSFESMLVEDFRILSEPQKQAVQKIIAKKILPCSNCQSKYNVSKFPGGKKVKCKKCGYILSIPRRITAFRLGPKKDYLEILANFNGLPIEGISIHSLLHDLGPFHKYGAQFEGKQGHFCVLKPQYTHLVHQEFFEYEYPFPVFPNLVSIQKVGRQGKEIYFLEEKEGVSLRERLQGELLEKAEVLEILDQVLKGIQEGFQSAFTLEVLRPEQIFLAGDEVSAQIKVEGFGLFRGNTLFPPPLYTSFHLAYAAPEVLDGKAPNESSALYSLGVILHEMITKEIPYSANHPLELISQIRQGQVQCNPEVLEDPSYGPLLLTLLQKDPSQRPSFKEMKDLIQQSFQAAGIMLEKKDEGSFTVHWNEEALGLEYLETALEPLDLPPLEGGTNISGRASVLMDLDDIQENGQEEGESSVIQALNALKGADLLDIINDQEQPKDQEDSAPSSIPKLPSLDKELQQLQTNWEEQTAAFAAGQNLPKEPSMDLNEQEKPALPFMGENPAEFVDEGGLTDMLGALAQEYPEQSPPPSQDSLPPLSSPQLPPIEGELPPMDFDPLGDEDISQPSAQAKSASALPPLDMDSPATSDLDDQDGLPPLPPLEDELPTEEQTLDIYGQEQDNIVPSSTAPPGGTYAMEAIAPPAEEDGNLQKYLKLIGGFSIAVLLLVIIIGVLLTYRSNQKGLEKAEQAFKDGDYY
ncbi:MAG: hypothetical protein D6785_11500, partial [Planctomycetota bacterium]